MAGEVLPDDAAWLGHLNPAGTQFDDAVVAIDMTKEHGLDLIDLSLRFNTGEMINPSMNEVCVMIKRAHRVRTEVSNSVATSWNLGIPQNAVREVARG